MASVYILLFLALQAQWLDCFERFDHQFQDDSNLGYSEYEFDNGVWNYWDQEFLDRPTERVHIARESPKAEKKAKSKKIKTTTPKKIVHDLNNTYFQSLESYEVKAVPVSDDKYRWVAKVVHSKHHDFPYVCTAACIEQHIFITAGRCLATLKVAYTTVIYDKDRFPAKVFVLPDQPTKQMFDDVGLIVVHPTQYSGKWPVVQVYSGKRSGNNFQWFADLNYTSNNVEHKAIGYTAQKFIHRMKNSGLKFRLTELEVIVDINTCHQILSHTGSYFFVPCYHSCNSQEFHEKAEKCTKYLGTEGAAVYNFKTNTLLGLATWGTSSMVDELPVGFTVPNSENYMKDLACARKIRATLERDPGKGYHQKLCL